MSGHADIIRRAYALGWRVHEDGSVISSTGRKRKPYYPKNKPYGMVTIRIDAKSTHFFVHKLAGYCWFGEPALAQGTEVRHLDNDSRNNAKSNLALGDHTSNMMDKDPAERRRIALIAAKARRSLADEQAIELVRLSRAGWTGKRLAAHFGLSKGQVSEILSGKLYSDVTGIPRRERRAA